ncbi:hypothetical protein AZ78_0821 [Lysobacter capsici AZ78]|uniref:Uncharacterized protein n=1 Tax=Lysobacter capsici AZ78 TaxID=1444315 RepID=A0A120AFM9_9GAMM|nr:hypothetical protein AZ78_0821 [Lysobacter capsici AZ78]
MPEHRKARSIEVGQGCRQTRDGGPGVGKQRGARAGGFGGAAANAYAARGAHVAMTRVGGIRPASAG